MTIPLARILIVDDEAAQMRALCDTLRDQGYETAGFTNGQEALLALRDKQFDVLLTDLMMPGMDGVALLGAALKIDPQLVGILMTGMGTIETAVQAMQSGALDYILKPFKLSAILPVLARAQTVRRLRMENLELRNTVAFHELTQAVAYTLDPKVLLDKIADAVLQQFEADEASIMLLCDEGRSLDIAAVRGERRDRLLGVRVPAGEGIAGWVATRREPLVLQGEVKQPAPLFARAEIQSALSMPMIARNRLVGVINVNCIRQRRAFAPGQIRALSVFTNAAAAGIEAARLYEEQRRADARYREVLHMAADGIISTDENQRIIVFNGGAESLFGYRTEEVLGKPLEMLLPAELATAHRRHVESFGQGPDPSRPMAARNSQLFGRRKDGTLFPIEAGISRRSENGEILYTAVVRDITERLRLEAVRREAFELETQNRRNQEASRLKSEFLANMSHELRTPLNAILGFGQLLHDGAVPDLPRQREFLEEIIKAGQHLLRLINDVLDLAKVEAGKLDFRPEEIDLDQVMGEVASIVRSIAVSKGIQPTLSVDPSLKSGVFLDPARLKQIIYNFVSNALKFTPPKGSIGVRALPQGDSDFRIEVEDSGPGIAPQDIDKLFVEFQQLDAGQAREHGGTGLGLALTRRLAEAQGGSAGVRSTPGVGSVFYAVLPRKSAPAPGPGLESRSLPDGLSVLVIEPDALDRTTLMEALTGEGYAVEVATTGAKALALCSERRFDAITLALLLPDMSGQEVLRTIRASGPNRDVPVVVVTLVRERGAVDGLVVNDFLPKPIQKDVLLDALRRAAVGSDEPGGVLVVDDDPSSLALMRATLTELGYRARCTADVEEALRSSERAPPSALVLDLLMPVMNGFEFLARFRSSPARYGIPVLIWTAKDLDADEHARLRRSAQGILRKSEGKLSILLEDLNRFLAARPRQEAEKEP